MTTVASDRRAFLKSAGVASLMALATRRARAATAWQPQYVLASCLYGTTDVAEILPEVAKTGATHVDLWPRVHGNQREQIDVLGYDRFAEILIEHDVRLGVLTRYDLGPFNLKSELEVAEKFGAHLVVCGGDGPVGLTGADLKQAVKDFVRRLEPTLVEADRRGVTIGIENHADNLIASPDALRWLGEFAANKPLGVALAPYHLPQEADALAGLVTELGKTLVHFYAWQHGQGATAKRPREEELMQLPGRGPLDFRPLVAALARQEFRGFVEIFMHPVPRGIPILSTTAEVTAEINRARGYLESRIPARS